MKKKIRKLDNQRVILLTTPTLYGKKIKLEKKKEKMVKSVSQTESSRKSFNKALVASSFTK